MLQFDEFGQTHTPMIPHWNLYFYLFILKNIYLFTYLFIYLLLAVLGLHCCTRAFSSCSELGLFFIAVRGLLTAVASLVAEHGL